MWGELEQAVVDRLAEQLRPVGPFAVVRSYGGELDADAVSEGAGLLPAAFVMVRAGKLQAVNVAQTRWAEELTVSVLVASAHAGGDPAVRLGTAAGPGIYTLMGRVLAGLMGWTPTGQDFAGFRPLRHFVSERTRQRTVYGLEFGTARILGVTELQELLLEQAPVPAVAALQLDFDANGDGEPESSALVALLETRHRRYIEQEPVVVPASQYYLRRLAQGDLVAVAGEQEEGR
jgi:phage gp37-like protein